MRLFLASYATVDWYDEIKRDLAPYFDAKWVEPRNLHLTWLFLGERDDVAHLTDMLQPLKMLPRLPLSIQGFGTFGEPAPHLFYLKTASVVTTILHEKIAEMLGESPESPFRPHITMARIKKLKKSGFEKIERPWVSEPLGTVDPKIYLIESRLTPAGPIYIPIEEF
ncbi:RNA 2',3'-cyclic phosphodiesterase [Hydrogenimonas sp.]